MRKIIVIIAVAAAILIGLVFFHSREGVGTTPQGVSESAKSRNESEKSFDSNSNEPKASPPLKQSEAVEREEPKTDGMATIAGLKIDLLFAESVPADLQRVIEIDIENTLASKESYEIFDSVKDTDGETKTMIEFYGGHAVPDPLADNLYEVRKDGGSKHLIVNRKVVEAYENAASFRQRNRLEFDELLKLRDRINRTSPDEVTIDNSEEIMSYATGELSAEIHRDAVASIVSGVFGEPSILDLQMRDPSTYGISAPSLPEGESLSAVIYAQEPSGKGFLPFLFFWDGSKWIAGLTVPDG